MLLGKLLCQAAGNPLLYSTDLHLIDFDSIREGGRSQGRTRPRGCPALTPEMLGRSHPDLHHLAGRALPVPSFPFLPGPGYYCLWLVLSPLGHLGFPAPTCLQAALCSPAKPWLVCGDGIPASLPPAPGGVRLPGAAQGPQPGVHSAPHVASAEGCEGKGKESWLCGRRCRAARGERGAQSLGA